MGIDVGVDVGVDVEVDIKGKKTYARRLIKALQTENQIASIAGIAMLPQENALPGTQRELAVNDGYREVGLRQTGLDMRGHIVWSFIVMGIQRRIFRYQLLNERLHIIKHFGICIFLNG